MANLISVPSQFHISKCKPVKLCLPFTTDLLDHSIYEVPITNNGVTLGSEGAIILPNKYLTLNSLQGDYSGEFTFETLINVKPTTEYGYFFTNKVSKVFNVSFPAISKTLQVASFGEAVNIDYTPYYNKNTLINIVCSMQSIKIYINGELKKENIRFNGMILRTNGTTIGYTANNEQLDAVVGGIKITYKALEPSQFSIKRPFEDYIL